LSAAGPLREANEGDAGAIVALWTEAYVTEGGGGRTLPYSDADFFETTHNGQVFVVERERAVIGVVALLVPGAPGRAVAEDDEAELSRLVVAASARRRGIGRGLAARCEALAEANGWAAIALWSRPYQQAAHRLYESLGYRRTAERDRVDDSGHERLVFQREL
jgi:ribosomal protein S18 acetylase RimI-like enzyme